MFINMKRSPLNLKYWTLFLTCLIGFIFYTRQASPLISNIENTDERRIIYYNDEDKTSFIWPDNDQCSSLSTRFSSDLQLTYLVSHPRSGNTWIRYMLESVTGVFTGSVYKDGREIELGFYGEDEPIDSGRIVVAKTHAQSGWYDFRWSFKRRIKYMSPDTPVILLLRNPFDAIISFWSLYSATQRDLQNDVRSFFFKASEDSYTSHEFRKFVESRINGWRQLAEDRLLWTNKLHIVFYENVQQDPINEMEKILKFLQFPVNQKRLNCLKLNMRGPAKRKQSKPKNYSFAQVDEAQIAYAMASVGSLILRRNFEMPQIYHDIIQNYTRIDI